MQEWSLSDAAFGDFNSCHICHCSFLEKSPYVIHRYTEPDKYEDYVGIKNIKRAWCICPYCGFYFQVRNYPIQDLEVIYKKGYRDKEFRGETIKAAFDRLNKLCYYESENRQRISWLLRRVERPGFLADIGTGIAVFPYEMMTHGWKCHATDENEHTKELLRELKIVHPFEFPYDLVTIIHVLEHIPDCDVFLNDIKKYFGKRTSLFVEVPDATEFDYLPKENDEFNSCHVYFFNISTLYRVLARNGYNIVDMTRIYYPKRNLSRILTFATLKQ